MVFVLVCWYWCRAGAGVGVGVGAGIGSGGGVDLPSRAQLAMSVALLCSNDGYANAPARTRPSRCSAWLESVRV